MSEMGYAVLDCDGRQMKVREGDTILLDKGDAGEKVELDRVLALRSPKGLRTGSPYVEGAKVVCIVGEAVRAPKVTTVKYKRRKGYRRKIGHRQDYVAARVESISAGRKKAAKKKEAKE
jgi:large subunit ribosomal protein L21